MNPTVTDFCPNVFELLVRQTAGTYYNKSTWLAGLGNEVDPNYSKLHSLTDGYKCGNSSFFTFQIMYPNGAKVVWTQQWNPTTVSATGFAEDIPQCGKMCTTTLRDTTAADPEFRGLALSNSQWTLMDGTPDQEWWYYAIGTVTPWDLGNNVSGIPGDDRSPKSAVELSVCPCS